jgi:hypothetical protein
VTGRARSRISRGIRSVDYNANAILTVDGTRTRTHDQQSDGHIVSASIGGSTVESYNYDPLGRRFSKTAGGTTTDDMHNDRGDEIAEYAASSATRTWTLTRKLMHHPRQLAPVATLGASPA